MHNTIDPHRITNFSRTESSLQCFLIYAICVAGKSSKQTAAKLNGWWVLKTANPFLWISNFTTQDLREELEDIKIGQYTRIAKALHAVANAFAYRSLKTATLDELENVAGIASKTSRFFLLHSRPNQRLAVLDTHLLAYLRENGICNTPKATPSKKKYLEIEKDWLDHCDKLGKSPADFDLEIWSSRSKS